jgi:uncharacterized protein YjdB
MKTTFDRKTVTLFSIWAAALLAAGLLFLAGCENPFLKELAKPPETPPALGDPVGDPEPIAVTGVTLNKASTSIVVGNTETLVPEISPAGAANKNLSWTSDNEAVASVEDGVVRAHSPGTAAITVTTVDGGFTAACAVTVEAEAAAVSGVKLNKSSVVLAVGGTETLIPTLQPANAGNRALTWSSSDTTIAAVSNDGVISGVALGTATITVTTAEGAFTAACEVTITVPSVPGYGPGMGDGGTGGLGNAQ